jgi:hypothetical protein
LCGPKDKHKISLAQIIMIPCKINLDEESDVQEKGENIFNLYDLEYHPGTSVVNFYNQYRNLFVVSLRKKGDTIKWQNNRVLTEDEQLTPTVEDLILANVLELVDMRLPVLVSKHYEHLTGKPLSLMDYKNEILARVPAFLKEIDGDTGNMVKEDLCKLER